MNPNPTIPDSWYRVAYFENESFSRKKSNDFLSKEDYYELTKEE